MPAIATDAVFAEYAPALRAFLAARCRDAELAGELTQEVAFRLVAAAPRLRANGNLRAYLFQVAANVWRDHLRRELVRHGALERLAGEERRGPAADDLVLERDLQAAVSRTLATLPPAQQDGVRRRSRSCCCADTVAHTRGSCRSRCPDTRRRSSLPSTRCSPGWKRRSLMRFRKLPFALSVLLVLPVAVRAQDSAQQAAAMQGMMQQILRDRPPQAEMAARDLWRRFALSAAALDSFRGGWEGEYGGEVAQLTTQHEMLGHAPDSRRRRLMTAMLGEEAQARFWQRSYRAAPSRERAGRARLTALLDRHFGAE